jgi:hypothetical protein
MTEIERLLVDYFETAGGSIVEQQDGEWFVFCGKHGHGVSLTTLAIEILRLQQRTPQESGQ